MSEPTTFELATIAANLAKTGEEDPKALVMRAYFLWKTSEQLLEHDKKEEKRRESLFGPRKTSEANKALLKGVKIPSDHVDLDEFLRRVLPREEDANRMKIFRDFLARHSPLDLPATQEIEFYRINGFNPFNFEDFACDLLFWLPGYKKEKRTASARIAGTASAAKRAEEKAQKEASAKKPKK